MINNVDKQLVFLNKEWIKLFKISTTTTYHYATVMAYRALHKITAKLGGLYYSHKPYYKVSNSNHTIHVTWSKVSDSVGDYSDIVKVINLLIWAISKVHHNKFGLFMAEWNYVQSMESNNCAIGKIMSSILKFGHVKMAIDKNWYKNNKFGYQNANYFLAQFAPCNDVTDAEDHILYPIKFRRLYHFITATPSKSHYSTLKLISENTSKLADNGSNNSSILSLLRQLHIFTGAVLQKKLIAKINYESDDDFNTIHDYGIGLSKISSPKVLFYYKASDPSTVHRVNNHELVKIVTAHKNAHKQYQQLLNKKSSINAKLNSLKDKYGL